MISHDSVWCWKGHMLPAPVLQMLEAGGQSMRFTRVITPMLKEAGITDAEIEAMLTENPRRYFEGEAGGGLQRWPEQLTFSATKGRHRL